MVSVVPVLGFFSVLNLAFIAIASLDLCGSSVVVVIVLGIEDVCGPEGA